MINYFKKGGTFTNIDVTKLDGFDKNNQGHEDIAWSTEKVNQVIKEYQDGFIELSRIKNSPFLQNDITFRKPRITFEYTREEMDELRKCAADPIYFADKFCKLKTGTGYESIKLRDYQQGLLEGFMKHRQVIVLASRQVGKTTTSAIFILWFVLFHKEKNVLMLGDILDTTKEIIDKVKQIMNNLPFFMKPGMLINNVQSMKLDNGCRIIGRSTTKKSAIGLSIDLLYMDEFAHISANFIDDFWRSTYPTISGTPGSRIIITSTPNGMNKFNTLWNSAIDAVEREGDSNFYPLRVDWWQVKGRDEEWKQKTIADLGSIEDFNQEYGLQFFKGDNLLLNSSDIKKLYNIKTKFVSRAIPCMNIDKTYFKKGEIHKVKTDFSQFLTWHPMFLKHNFTSDIDDLKKDDNYYVFGIDTSKGVGKDYHVCNIFKVAPMPLNRVLMNKNNIEEEIDVFSLIQIGMFRCNSINIETFSDVVNTIVFDLFNYENVRIGIELNNQGILVRDKLLKNANYWTGMIIFNKKNDDDLYYEPGTNLSSNKMKVKYCESFQQNVSIDKIITTSEITFAELSNFGSNEGRTIYRCQTGHDDIALSCIHANAFIGSPQYKEIGWDYWDKLERDSSFAEYRRIVQHDVIEENQERNGTGARFDLNEVMDMQ